MGEYKNYRLLKDLPFAKAGTIFESRILDDGKEYMFWGEIKTQNIKNFDEWFEEIKEPKEYFYITTDGFIWVCPKGKDTKLDEDRKSVGNYFEAHEEAEKYLDYLRARIIIKQDAEDFKPDWTDQRQPKYYGYWYFKKDKPEWSANHITKSSGIYFNSREALEASFEKYPEEWKTYLTYEQ